MCEKKKKDLVSASSENHKSEYFKFYFIARNLRGIMISCFFKEILGFHDPD